MMGGGSKGTSDNTQGTTDHDAAAKATAAIFHDFLGGRGDGLSPAAVAKSGAGDFSGDVGPSHSASVSVGASSGAGAGGLGPISSTSDLGSERQVGNHLEGVPYYGPRSDFYGSEMGNRFRASKRSSSDSAYMGSSRDGFHHMRPDITENPHLMKILRSTVGERPRRPHEDEIFKSIHAMRPTTSSLVQPATSSRLDANASKWERAIPVNVGPVVQNPQRSGQVVPYGYQAFSNRFKDTHVSPLVISQSAADEGSRTGNKGSAVLSSVNASGGIADRSMPGTSKQKFGTCVPEPGSSTPIGSRPASTSAGRQMTIFYGGQAHVFDDVHPNKADVIMALAGSNGGSWSTSYGPTSTVKLSGENDIGMATNSVKQRDSRERIYAAANSNQGLGSGDRMLMLPGQGSVVVRDAKAAVQAAGPITEDSHKI